MGKVALELKATSRTSPWLKFVIAQDVAPIVRFLRKKHDRLPRRIQAWYENRLLKAMERVEPAEKLHLPGFDCGSPFCCCCPCCTASFPREEKKKPSEQRPHQGPSAGPRLQVRLPRQWPGSLGRSTPWRSQVKREGTKEPDPCGPARKKSPAELRRSFERKKWAAAGREDSGDKRENSSERDVNSSDGRNFEGAGVSRPTLLWSKNPHLLHSDATPLLAQLTEASLGTR